MITFACTVKDLFRRPKLINKTVRALADHGYVEHAVTYALIRDNISKALVYASSNMRDHEYKAGMAYLESRYSENKAAERTHYTPRTLRRYIHRVCDLISEYYERNLDIRFLPLGAKLVDFPPLSGSFWEKVNTLAGFSLEAALVVVKCVDEKRSSNMVCKNYGMGGVKVKRILEIFNESQDVYGILMDTIRAV